jgi:hypothetical protein
MFDTHHRPSLAPALLIMLSTGQLQVLNVFRQSFDQEFEPDKIDMQNCGRDVKEEILLAKAESDRLHQSLQHIETEALKKGVLGLLLHSKSHAKTVKEMRLEKYEVDSRAWLLLSPRMALD